VAKVKNISPDRLSLFRPDAPPIDAGDEVTVSDANFIGRAWPMSTWELVEPPLSTGGYVDQSTDDAHLWVAPEPSDTEASAPAPKRGKQS